MKNSFKVKVMIGVISVIMTLSSCSDSKPTESYKLILPDQPVSLGQISYSGDVDVNPLNEQVLHIVNDIIIDDINKAIDIRMESMPVIINVRNRHSKTHAYSEYGRMNPDTYYHSDVTAMFDETVETDVYKRVSDGWEIYYQNYDVPCTDSALYDSCFGKSPFSSEQFYGYLNAWSDIRGMVDCLDKQEHYEITTVKYDEKLFYRVQFFGVNSKEDYKQIVENGSSHPIFFLYVDRLSLLPVAYYFTYKEDNGWGSTAFGEVEITDVPIKISEYGLKKIGSQDD